MTSTGFEREGRELGEHAVDIVAKAGEQVADGAQLVFATTVTVWRNPDGELHVVTLETDF